jgi:hypothetical protein
MPQPWNNLLSAAWAFDPFFSHIIPGFNQAFSRHYSGEARVTYW